MKPAINMGDIVITGPRGGLLTGEVKPGTIVTYQRGDELVTHRVLSVNGDALVTKGDAMEDPDPWTVSLSDISGVYLLKIPYVGYVADFVRTKLGWFLLIILPATALVALLVRDIVKELRRKPEKVIQKKEVMPRDGWD
jgi:signal peptidase